MKPTQGDDGAWTLPGGWTAEKRSFFDEEGVEGWVWIDAHGKEQFWEIGVWEDPPPVPEDMTRGLN